jgi:hypothetical protein
MSKAVVFCLTQKMRGKELDMNEDEGEYHDFQHPRAVHPPGVYPAHNRSRAFARRLIRAEQLRLSIRQWGSKHCF